MSAIHVCPLSALDTILKSSQAVQMISLSGPGKTTETPAQITNGHLKLKFNDINEPREGLIAPASEHVRSIIEFAHSWDQTRPLVIHCWMGISRSTAATAIVLHALLPNVEAELTAKTIRKKSPMATPNPLMIKHADGLLKLNGDLTRAIEKIGRGKNAFEGQPFSISLEELNQ